MSIQFLAALDAAAHPARLPLYSEVACGFPSPAEPFSEARLSLDELIHLREPSMFLVRAMGSSMVGAGIYPGDVLVVDRAREARHRDIIVAYVNNGFTVKRLCREADQVSLQPESPDHSPTLLSDGEELLVWGVCTWNLHRLTP